MYYLLVCPKCMSTSKDLVPIISKDGNAVIDCWKCKSTIAIFTNKKGELA